MPPGFYTAADEAVLTTYAMSGVMYRNALALVARDGMVIATTTGEQTAPPR